MSTHQLFTACSLLKSRHLLSYSVSSTLSGKTNCLYCAHKRVAIIPILHHLNPAQTRGGRGSLYNLPWTGSPEKGLMPSVVAYVLCLSR